MQRFCRALSILSKELASFYANRELGEFCRRLAKKFKFLIVVAARPLGWLRPSSSQSAAASPADVELAAVGVPVGGERPLFVTRSGREDPRPVCRSASVLVVRH